MLVGRRDITPSLYVPNKWRRFSFGPTGLYFLSYFVIFELFARTFSGYSRERFRAVRLEKGHETAAQ